MCKYKFINIAHNFHFVSSYFYLFFLQRHKKRLQQWNFSQKISFSLNSSSFQNFEALWSSLLGRCCWFSYNMSWKSYTKESLFTLCITKSMEKKIAVNIRGQEIKKLRLLFSCWNCIEKESDIIMVHKKSIIIFLYYVLYMNSSA